ncbi:hypothetical protein [Indiicoccus explosivorum]|uniref:hypothetical protein n=1 Tax=Indiicoccus explosivorum TaxID=1917864 RepID=UPI000B45381D|nr:hypothetical protein [Indiicoccus explosivorum]
MKKAETAAAVFLIAAGVLCLTMSAGWFIEPQFTAVMATFMQVCLWMGLPIAAAGTLYWHIKQSRRQ